MLRRLRIYACSRMAVTPFDMKIDNNYYESDIQDEHVEMHVGLEAKALFKKKTISEYWSNINTATDYP